MLIFIKDNLWDKHTRFPAVIMSVIHSCSYSWYCHVLIMLHKPRSKHLMIHDCPTSTVPPHVYSKHTSDEVYRWQDWNTFKCARVYMNDDPAAIFDQNIANLSEEVISISWSAPRHVTLERMTSAEHTSRRPIRIE